MPKQVKTTSINLIPKYDISQTSVGKSLQWVLTVGKTIVFLTFSAVVFSFVYRFSLDKKIEALNEQIEHRVDQITEFQDEEFAIRNLQAKLDFVDELLSEQPNMLEVFRSVENSLPVQSKLDSITFSRNVLSIEGKTKNEVTFSNLLDSLTKQKIFNEIVINNLKSGGVQNPEINFEINLKVEGQTE